MQNFHQISAFYTERSINIWFISLQLRGTMGYFQKNIVVVFHSKMYLLIFAGNESPVMGEAASQGIQRCYFSGPLHVMEGSTRFQDMAGPNIIEYMLEPCVYIYKYVFALLTE